MITDISGMGGSMLDIKKSVLISMVLYMFIPLSCNCVKESEKYSEDGINISLSLNSDKKTYKKSDKILIEFTVSIKNETGDSVYLDNFSPIDVYLLKKGFWGCYKNYEYLGEVITLPVVIDYQDINIDRYYRNRDPETQKKLKEKITKNPASKYYGLDRLIHFLYERLFLETNSESLYILKFNAGELETGKYIVQVVSPSTLALEINKFGYELAKKHNIDITQKNTGFIKWNGIAKSNSISFEVAE